MLLVCIFILIMLAGCRQSDTEESEKQAGKPAEEPLVIFYLDGAGNILDNFLVQNPDLNVKVYNPIASEESFEEMIGKSGEPDLILLPLGGNPQNIPGLEDKYAADIMKFFENDAAINMNAYFPETFDVFRDEETMWAIPLGISIPTITLREENWIGSAFEALDDGYSAIELLNAMESEIDKAAEEGILFSGEIIDGSFYDSLNRLGAIQKTENGVTIDEEIFERLYRMAYKRRKSQTELQEYLTSMEVETPEDTSSGMDPRNYAGQFIVSEWYGGAPQVYLTYGTSVNMHYFKQDTYVLYYPTVNGSDSIGAHVEVMGMVGKNSSRQQEAYELLRKMMDTQTQVFVQPGASLDGTLCPVNIDNAHTMIDNFEQTLEQWYGESEDDEFEVPKNQRLNKVTGAWYYGAEIVLMSEEEEEKLRETLDNISFLYRNDEAELKTDEIIGRYMGDMVEDYEGCYVEFMQQYNPKTIEEQTEEAETETGWSEDNLKFWKLSGMVVEDEALRKQVEKMEPVNSIEAVVTPIDTNTAELNMEKLCS